MMENTQQRFGTFQGVFLPSTLTILGVIMYLRMGWVVGHAGVIPTLIIITLATAITFLTGLSISATATNMKVETGGAYFMISRSLGLEAGAAIGLPLFVSQALGISFYIVGFSESLQAFFPALDPKFLSIAVLCLLTVVAYVSAELALKLQLAVFIVISLSVFVFLWGPLDPPTFSEPPFLGNYESFWVVFAVFFPAVTGILTGVSMSGDLKNAGHSIPRGTLAAVLVGYVIYISIAIVLAWRVPEAELISDPLIMVKVAAVPFLIFLGLWGATLSSALGSLLGAPRTLQALGIDGIVPQVFARTYGADENPRVATVMTFLVALVGILLGDLNAIAPVLSMFFLTSYGVLNLSAGFEELISNPSWRPRFRVPWAVSMLGAFGCFAVMFMINPGATFIALFATITVYIYMQRRQIKSRWGDVRRGILMFLARYSIYHLAEMAPHAKSWRPNFLVLSGVPTSRWYLVAVAHWITRKKGFMSVAVVLSRDTAGSKVLQAEASIADFLHKKDVQSLVEVSESDDIWEGLRALIQSYGMGPLVPNTILMGESEREDNYESFIGLVKFIHRSNRNVVIMRENAGVLEMPNIKRIDVWWGRERQNAGLMLALGYMLAHSPGMKARLVLKSIVDSEKEATAAKETLGHFVLDGRLDIDVDVIVRRDWRSHLRESIHESSRDADLVFMGLRPPDTDEPVADYVRYYKQILAMTAGLPPVMLVAVAEDIDFIKIFD